ncbi:MULTISPECIES: hypothetical protein [Campylobacter]|uniref:Phosphatidylglycerophosphate synthase n=1 Tax=Campylobacter porcelli TaxID=1660073 RepID=A0A1X9SV85_9BACT|nr:MULTISPECIES: hypothetical protein [unclassified Campylobacter]MCR8678993.1 hypothetical protein [Campylobacter sp. RM19072]MCR8696262.1 hypothetical protein [Campylobacter sp. RM19073]MEE3705008.1 hypothetical protein [Campylobacter sp. CX2-8023-23]MEE3777012.1 hypothetical protein [Campylobacter sp. CX2-4080-23]ARR00188.1 hypothetical protein CSUIS_0347 [Campylobacter sp. RM6137]
MANGIEKLLEMDLKEITKRTHIETEYLEYMCEKNYEKLRKLNASGFAKIISREYGLDLQDWIDEYNAYCKENGCAGSSNCSVAPKIPAYTPKSDNSKALTIILIIALIAVAIVWLIKFTNILDGIELLNFEKNQSIAYSATTVVESAKENLKSTDSVAAQNDENITNIEDNKTLAISDDNATITESNSTIQSIEIQTPQIVNQADKIAKIIPAKSIWIGIKNIDGKNKKSYTTKNALDINLSIDQLIQTGHGELTLELDGNQKKFTLQKPLRFVVENGVIKEIDYAEFVKLNRGAQW